MILERLGYILLRISALYLPKFKLCSDFLDFYALRLKVRGLQLTFFLSDLLAL